MRLLIVSPWQERCGNAIYAENLVMGLQQFPVEVEVLPSTSDPQKVNWVDYDVFYFNYISGMSLNPTWLKVAPYIPCKKVLTHHCTDPAGNRSAFTDLFDAVVVHHKAVATEAPNFVHIPHGILEVPGEPPSPNGLVIGSAGFPQPFKGLVEICQAVALISEARVFFVMPESRWGDALAMAEACRAILGDRFTAVHGWLPDVEVVELLGQTSVGVFDHVDWAPGVGGAVRLAIAAKVPVIVPNLWHFRDLREHVYLSDIHNPQALADAILLAHRERKDCWSVPIAEMGWSTAARMYYDLFMEVTSG